MKSTEYLQGYKEALLDVAQHLDTSIRRNNGCTTGVQAFQVVSDMAYFIQSQTLALRSEEVQPSQKVFVIVDTVNVH